MALSAAFSKEQFCDLFSLLLTRIEVSADDYLLAHGATGHSRGGPTRDVIRGQWPRREAGLDDGRDDLLHLGAARQVASARWRVWARGTGLGCILGERIAVPAQLVLGELAAGRLHRAHSVRSEDGSLPRTVGGAGSVEAIGLPASEVGTTVGSSVTAARRRLR